MSVKKNQVLVSSVQREFDPSETLLWVKRKPLLFICWGATKFTNYENKALFFNVSGMKHKGIVLITLAWDDTYTVRLLSSQWNEKAVFEGVYCDSLCELIDEKIEKIDAYEY